MKVIAILVSRFVDIQISRSIIFESALGILFINHRIRGRRRIVAANGYNHHSTLHNVSELVILIGRQ